MKDIIKFSLLFSALSLVIGCGNHKNTPALVGVMIDSTQTNDSWEVKEASFGDNMDIAVSEKGKQFVNHTNNIKTILLYAGNSEMNAPFLTLNQEEQLTLSFDVLDQQGQNLAYRLVHCDARWNKSDIFDTDFISGTNNTPINEVANSFNTTVNYQNYRTYIPSEYNTILLSGNYLVEVFETATPDSVLFHAPFYVVNQQVTVKPQMVAPRINEARRYMQNINFTIQHPSYPISNPFQDIYVVAIQNQQRYLVKEGLQPAFTNDNELVYNYDEPTYFEGGNEFRFFDLKSLNYQTPEVASIVFDGNINKATLATGEKRTFKIYTSQPDINGRFLIQNDDGQDPHTDADYIMTHFELKFDFDLPNGTIYVAGGLSQNQLLPQYAMTYNREKGAYEADVLLKQGYYNYQYITKYDNSDKIEIDYVEGSHSETENDYSILVYHKNLSLNTHELIGYQRFNSVK